MKFTEQLRRLIKAAPNLPVQTMTGITLLIAFPILLNLGYHRAFDKWEKLEAFPIEFTDVQERIRNKKPDYFYKKSYYFLFKGDTLHQTYDIGFSELSDAETSLSKSREGNKAVSHWLNLSTKELSFIEPDHDWVPYIVFLLFITFPLIYFKWLLLKYYELELHEK